MFLVLGIIAFLIWVYIVFLRDKLFAAFPQLEWVRATENKLWLNSRTILAARLYWIAGILIAVQQVVAASGVDITPFLSELVDFIPEKYRALFIAGFMALTGILFEYLRKITTQSVEANVEENKP